MAQPRSDAPETALQAGEILGHFRVESRIGIGGMGVVYRARDEQLDRTVALKVLPWTLPPGAPARRRLHEEARALSRLNHPNIATIHDFLTDERRDVIVMEYVEGHTLSDRLKQGPLPESVVIELGLQLADGLAAAHDHGVIHRDVKPGNLRVTPEGRLKILDFGLARRVDPDATTASTHTGAAVGWPAGTLPYLAPEQLEGGGPSRLTDVYATGVTLYEMATASRPFDGNARALVDAILTGTAPAPSTRRAGLSRGFDRVVLRAMDKHAGRRHSSAHALRADLELLTTAMPAVTTTGFRPGRRAVLGTGAVAVVGALAWVLFPRTAAAPFRERGWVVLADFDNQTGDAGLARVVQESLAIALQQSAYVNLLPRAEVLEVLARMRRSGTTTINEDLAVEVCRRDGRQLVLAGSLERSGTVVRIVARAVNPADRTLVFAVPAEFSRPDELFAQIDRLARLVRERLGESLPVIQQASEPLARVTTSSFEALQRYSEGRELVLRGNPDDAVDRFTAALVLDPNFAMAHHALARAYDQLGRRDRALEHFDRAYALRDGVTLRERHAIDGEFFGAHERYGEAEEAYSVLVGLYPDDADAWYELSLARAANGHLTDAIAAIHRQLEIRPESRPGLELLVLQQSQNDQPAEALESWRHATTVLGETPRLRWGAGMAYFGLGRLGEARTALAALGTEGSYGNIARLYLSRIDAFEGSLSAAADGLSRDIERDRREGLASAELLRRYLLARIALLKGRPADARAEADAIAAAPSDRAKATNLQHAGTLYAELGDAAGAQRMLSRVQAIGTESPSPFVQSCVRTLEGAVAALRKDWSEAADAFRAARAAYPNVLAARSRARALEAAGTPDAAVEAWADVIAMKGRILRDGFSADWPLAHLDAARLLIARGRAGEARGYLGVLLDTWTGSDAEPLRREAERLGKNG